MGIGMYGIRDHRHEDRVLFKWISWLLVLLYFVQYFKTSTSGDMNKIGYLSILEWFESEAKKKENKKWLEQIIHKWRKNYSIENWFFSGLMILQVIDTWKLSKSLSSDLNIDVGNRTTLFGIRKIFLLQFKRMNWFVTIINNVFRCSAATTTTTTRWQLCSQFISFLQSQLHLWLLWFKNMLENPISAHWMISRKCNNVKEMAFCVVKWIGM